MISALVAGALAALLWPDPGAVRRNRLATAAQGWNAPERLSRLPPGLPVAPTAALAAAARAAAGSTALVALLAGIATFLGVRARLARQQETRTDARLAALAEGLAALAAELRSGRSLEAATAAAVGACADEESGRRLTTAVRSPATTGEPAPEDDALSGALHRISAGVRLSTRTGCSLAAVAGAVEDDLRARARHRQELRSVTAGPRASAVVLAGLPVLGLAMGSGVGADPWRVLTTTGTGQVLLVVGFTLELAGLAWTARLVSRAVR